MKLTVLAQSANSKSWCIVAQHDTSHRTPTWLAILFTSLVWARQQCSPCIPSRKQTRCRWRWLEPVALACLRTPSSAAWIVKSVEAGGVSLELRNPVHHMFRWNRLHIPRHTPDWSGTLGDAPVLVPPTRQPGNTLGITICIILFSPHGGRWYQRRMWRTSDLSCVIRWCGFQVFWKSNTCTSMRHVCNSRGGTLHCTTLRARPVCPHLPAAKHTKTAALVLRREAQRCRSAGEQI